MTSTLGSVYTPDVQRYIVQSSDVLSEHRLTVSPLADPSSVIWYTERYLSHPPSGHPEIVENIVHSPTNTICWSVHRPTNIRRQGWYVRLRSPMFPPGVSIPMQPVGTTSPYYVDGALSFKCRTTPPPLPPGPSHSVRGMQNGRERDSMSSTASTSSSSSSRTAVHSYPPTPAASSPPVPLIRPELPPLNVSPHSSRAGKGRSLTGEGDGVYIIGLEDDPEHERTGDQTKTPTSAATARPPTSPPLAELDVGDGILEEPLTPTHASQSSQSSTKGKDPLSPLESVPPQQPPPNALPKRMPPPRQLPPSITEFILVPLAETASASCGPFVNLSPSVVASSPSPTTPAYPHSHHRTHSNSFSRNGPLANGTPPRQRQRNSGMFGKALTLLKSTLPTSVTNTVTATWQGNSFTIVRIPESPQPSSSVAPTPLTNGGNGKGSLLSLPTSTANLLGTPGASSANGVGQGAFDGWTQQAISSAAFVQPLPPPLLSFTDETSLFGPLPWVGFGSLLGASPFSSTLPGSSNGRRQTQPVSLPVTSPTSAAGVSSSTALAPPFPIPSPSSSLQPPPPVPQRGKPTANYTTLGTLTVSTSQLASLGVDTAFWITCALVFWGYLEEREGYLSANDD